MRIARYCVFLTRIIFIALIIFIIRIQVRIYRFKEKKIETTVPKFILLWSCSYIAPLYYFENGKESFRRYECRVNNCFVTANRRFFRGDLKYFDAILFTGRKKICYTKDLPATRYAHQKYVFADTESSETDLICDKNTDGYFNWTVTYKLNSDIPIPYIIVKDTNGNIVGPKQNMHWIENMTGVHKSAGDKVLKYKRTAVAWFVSDCETKSQREIYAKMLQESLSQLGLNHVQYGTCSGKICSLKTNRCLRKLKRHIFFYLAFENSFSEDYVTGQVLHALQNNVVPIVYGGANYSRFLPPGSYLDARSLGPKELAEKIYALIHSPELYLQFFNWQSYYSFDYPLGKKEAFLCKFCENLNDETKFNVTSVYWNFRSWWNKNYNSSCATENVEEMIMSMDT